MQKSDQQNTEHSESICTRQENDVEDNSIQDIRRKKEQSQYLEIKEFYRNVVERKSR